MSLSIKESELRDCPFCGSNQLTCHLNAVICDGCSASGPDIGEVRSKPLGVPAIEAWNTRAPAACGEREACIKPLEWMSPDGEGRYLARSLSIVGHYTIADDGFADPPLIVTLHQLVIGRFANEREAKSAVQADYVKRILSALSAVQQSPKVEGQTSIATKLSTSGAERSETEDALREALDAMLSAFAEGVVWNEDQRAAYERAGSLLGLPAVDGDEGAALWDPSIALHPSAGERRKESPASPSNEGSSLSQDGGAV